MKMLRDFFALLLLCPCFLWAEDFRITINNGEATIIGYNGSGGDVVIPEFIAGFPVRSIDDDAFYSCSSLTSIITSVPILVPQRQLVTEVAPFV